MFKNFATAYRKCIFAKNGILYNSEISLKPDPSTHTHNTNSINNLIQNTNKIFTYLYNKINTSWTVDFDFDI